MFCQSILAVVITIFITVKCGVVQPDTCTITVDELQHLNDLINNFDKTRTGKHIPINATVTKSDPCTELIIELENGIAELSNIYQDLLNESVSNKEYEALKQSYEDKIQELNKEFDDLLQAADQQSKQEIEKLITQVQDLQAALNQALKELEDERAAHRETKIKLCVSKIQLGKYDEAVDIFIELDDDDLLERILSDTLDNSLDYFNNCFGFLYALEEVNPALAEEGAEILADLVWDIIMGTNIMIDNILPDTKKSKLYTLFNKKISDKKNVDVKNK